MGISGIPLQGKILIEFVAAVKMGFPQMERHSHIFLLFLCSIVIKLNCPD